MSARSWLRSKKAFTLIELLVVIAIIGILAVLVITQVGLARIRARNTAAKSDISQGGNSIEAYKTTSDTDSVLAAVHQSPGSGQFGYAPIANPNVAYAACCGPVGTGDRLTGTVSDNFSNLFNGTTSPNYYPAKFNKTPSATYIYEYRTQDNKAALGTSPNDYHDVSAFGVYTLAATLSTLDPSADPYVWINNGNAGSGQSWQIPAP